MTALPDSGGYATRIAAHAHAATAAAIAAGRVLSSTQRITEMPTARHAAGEHDPEVSDDQRRQRADRDADQSPRTHEDEAQDQVRRLAHPSPRHRPMPA